MNPIFRYQLDDQVNPNEKIATYYLERELLFETPDHTHDHYEFFLMYEGEIGHSINGKSVPLSEGMLSFFCPKDVHGFVDLGKFIRCVNFVIRTQYLEQLIDSIGGTELWIFLNGEGKYMRLEPMAATCLMDAALNYSSFHEIEPLHLHLVTFALGQAILSAKLQRHRKDIPEWLGEVVRAYQFASKFTQPINALYTMCGRSREHVCRSFRKYLGVTPTQFLNALRLNHAHYLLSSTQHSVLDVSMMSGFDSLSHFNHLFHLKYGKPPSECR